MDFLAIVEENLGLNWRVAIFIAWFYV